MSAHSSHTDGSAGRPLKVALAGFGMSGEFIHLPLLQHAGFDVVAVLTSRADRVRQSLPAARVVQTFDDLLGVPGIDVLVIATPNDGHVVQATAGLRAGLHVVVDKPVALSVRELDELIALSQRQQRLLVPFHNRRRDGDWLTVRALCEGGELGRIVQFRARWDRYRPVVADRWRERPEAGGGVLLDLGTHLIDQAIDLFGMPDSVCADVRMQRQGALVDDAFELLLDCGAVQVSLAATMLAAAPDARYRLHGTRGSFVKSGLDPQEDWLRSGRPPVGDDFGLQSAGQWGTLTIEGQPQARAVETLRGDWPGFYRMLHLAVVAGGDPPVPALAARNVLQIIEAARDSSRQGRRVALT